MPEILQNTLDFLRDLRTNNNKAWFDQHRKQYDAARGHFEEFVSELIMALSDIEDLGGVTAKDCIFRINRDIRFSPDKTPYKTNMSAVIGQGGKKAAGRSYYVQIAPDGQSMLAGGVHSPSSQELEKVRRSIADDPQKFKKTIQNTDFKRYFGSLQGDSLKTAPQGYPKDHPEIELLRMKQFLAEHDFSDKDVLSSDLASEIVAMCKAMQPFVTFIESALSS